jgi:hypothetical protein
MQGHFRGLPAALLLSDCMPEQGSRLAPGTLVQTAALPTIVLMGCCQCLPGDAGVTAAMGHGAVGSYAPNPLPCLAYDFAGCTGPSLATSCCWDPHSATCADLPLGSKQTLHGLCRE